MYINEKWTKCFESEAIITIRKVVLKTSAISNNSTTPGINNNRIIKYPMFISKKAIWEGFP